MPAQKTSRSIVENDLPMALREGEQVLARAKISAGIYWKTAAILVVAILLLLFVAKELAMLFFIVAGVAYMYAFMIKRALLMIVTNQRLFVRAGIIKVDTAQIRLDRIESVEIQRTIPGQFLDYATLVVTGVGSALTFIPYMENAKEIRDILNDLLYTREEKPTHVIVDKVEIP